MDIREGEAGAGTPHAASRSLPFDAAKLDDLLEDAGIDVLVVSSKHNIQYLFGGYRFFFFDHFDAIGLSRYLPLLVYARGRPEDAAYFGNPMEGYEEALGKFWTLAFREGLGIGSGHGAGRRPYRTHRQGGGADRHRAGLPAGRRRGSPAARPAGGADRRGGGAAGTPAGGQDSGGTRIICARRRIGWSIQCWR